MISFRESDRTEHIELYEVFHYQLEFVDFSYGRKEGIGRAVLNFYASKKDKPKSKCKRFQFKVPSLGKIIFISWQEYSYYKLNKDYFEKMQQYSRSEHTQLKDLRITYLMFEKLFGEKINEIEIHFKKFEKLIDEYYGRYGTAPSLP